MREIARLREHGWEGGYILPHRAFRKLDVRTREIVSGAALLVAGLAGWVALLPKVARFWERLLAFWIQGLNLGWPVYLLDGTVLGHWSVSVPYLPINAGPASGGAWLAIAIGTTLLFVLSFKLPKDTHLPIAYLLRALCIIQSTALIYSFAGRRFPHDPAQYCSDMLLFGIVFIGLVPVLLALTFYVFDVSFLRKLTLTALIMGDLVLFVPLQYLLHAWLLRVSLLFLPVLYFVFGPFLEMIIFIGFYAWGMSWSSIRRGVVQN